MWTPENITTLTMLTIVVYVSLRMFAIERNAVRVAAELAERRASQRKPLKSTGDVDIVHVDVDTEEV